MIFFDHANRGTFYPRSLVEGEIRGVKYEIQQYLSLDLTEMAQTDVPNVWRLPLGSDVLVGLRELSYGRCAFCESPAHDLRPYRFRPPAHARGNRGEETKSCYLWLAFNWENLFPICSECVPAEKNYFSVTGNRASIPHFTPDFDGFQGPGLDLGEQPILLYPGELRAARNLLVRRDGVLHGLTRRGHATIDHFHLNRSDLMNARAEAIKRVVHNLVQGEYIEHLIRPEVTDVGYPGTAYLTLRAIATSVRRQTGKNISVSRLGIIQTLERVRRGAGGMQLIHQAIRDWDDDHKNEEVTQDPTPPTPQVPSPLVDFQQPRLKHVNIRNFKSLETIAISMPETIPDRLFLGTTSSEFADQPEAPCLLILGENATGKSSLLEAITLTCISSQLRAQVAEPVAKLVLDPDYMGSPDSAQPQHGSIDVEFHDGPSLSLRMDRLSGDMSTTSDRYHPLIFAYGAHRLFDRSTRVDPVRHVDTLFRRDRQIANPEPWLIELSKTAPKALNEVVSALRHIIQIDGHFRNIEVRRDTDGREYCAINIQRSNPDGVVMQRLGSVSSGYRAVLAVVCDIFARLLSLAGNDYRAARHASAIVLIDEIEAHLHPRWKMQIVTGLRRALPRATFILTTHDPLCLRGMLNGEVVMLNRYRNSQPSGGSVFSEVVEYITDLPNIENLTIDQLLTSDIFQLFSTDDRRIEAAFAQVPALLEKEVRFSQTGDEGARLTELDRSILTSFREEIAAGLPYGKTEVSRLVQEAVAEYVAQRRSQNARSNHEARERAKSSVKAYLADLLG